MLLQMLYVGTKDFTIWYKEGNTQFQGIGKEGWENIFAND